MNISPSLVKLSTSTSSMEEMERQPLFNLQLILKLFALTDAKRLSWGIGLSSCFGTVRSRRKSTPLHRDHLKRRKDRDLTDRTAKETMDPIPFLEKMLPRSPQ